MANPLSALICLAVFFACPPEPCWALGSDEVTLAELEEVLRERNLDPYSPLVLERLSDLSGRKGDMDGEVAYLLYAIDAYDQLDGLSEEGRAKKIRTLGRKLERASDGLGSLQTTRNTYLKDLTWVLRLYANNQKKYRNALAVGGRILSYRPDHPTAQRIVKEVMTQGDDALRQEGRRLLRRRELTRPRSFLAAWARDHKTWQSAGIVESTKYVVKSNIGYDVASKAAQSLDQIADYYATFFEVDQRLIRQKTPVNLCKTRAGFVRVANNPITANPTLRAFITSQFGNFSLQGNYELRSTIFGYDPRDKGGTLDSLWPILWHEASHQYMSLVTQGRGCPDWISEGMPSYFEGATFSAEGVARVGLPARGRLENLVSQLSSGEHPLLEVLDADSGLTGAQYSVAWGIVYFLRHARNESGELRRPKACSDLLEILRGGSPSGPQLFQQGVLAEGEQSLGDFTTEWEQWILALLELERSRMERARQFSDLGLQSMARGDTELAADLFGEALLRDPEHLPALKALLDMQHARWEDSRKKDRGIADLVLFMGSKLHAIADHNGDEQISKAALDLCVSTDKAGYKKIKKAEGKYTKKIERVIQRMLEKGRPRTAVAIAKLYLDNVLGGNRRDSLSEELRASGTLNLERSFAAFDRESLLGLSASASDYRVDRGVLRGAAKRPREAPLNIDRALSPLFRLQGEFQLGDANTVLGLCYSTPEQVNNQGFVLRLDQEGKPPKVDTWYKPFDVLKMGHFAELDEGYIEERLTTGFKLSEKTTQLPPGIKAQEWHSFELSRIQLGQLILLIDGKQIASRQIDPRGSVSRLGLVLWGGELQIRRLDVLELNRL